MNRLAVLSGLFGLLALLAALVLMFAGCATSNIVMKNPRTQAIQVCQRPSFGEIRAAENCAEALERDGWIRLQR
jgi:hypothetical protein